MDPADRPDGSGTGPKVAEHGIASAVAESGAPAAGRTLRRMRNALAGIFIALAVLLGLLRFGFPAIENHRPQVEQWVGELLQRPVTIDSLRAYWRGWSPELELHGLKMFRAEDNGADGGPIITFDQVRISVDPVESVKSRRLLTHTVTILGASLTVRRFQDGSIYIAGMQPVGGSLSPRMPSDLARWILKDGTLVFDSATVSWVDARRGNTPVLLTSARLEFSNIGNDHRLSGSFRIPGISDDRIQFALDASGDLSSSDWSGRMAISANGIRASQLDALFKTAGRWISGGRSDLSIWADWDHGEMERARMTIRADGLMLSDTLGGLRVHGGTADVQVGRLENGWGAELMLSEVHTSEGRWPASRGTLNYGVGDERGGPRLVGRLDHARLADIASLLQSRLKKIEFASAAMETYRPSADLSNLHFSVGLGEGDVETFALTADFAKLSAFVGPAFPALSGYSGHLEIDGNAGVVRMNGGTLDFALEGVFDGRFLLETRGGRVAWEKTADGARLDVYDVGVSATGVAARLSGFARYDGDASGPLLNLVANLSSEDIGELRRYIPGGILKPKLTDWLRRSIRSGRVSEGKILLHGRLADFPFDKEEGVFEARFAVDDGELDYAPGWPALSELSGELRFRGRRLDATVHDGRVFDSRIDQGVIAIDRLGQGVPVVEIRGKANGTAAQGLKFLRESPLKERFAKHLGNVVAAGNVGLALEMDVPLDKSGIRVNGRVALNGNSIDFPNLKSGLKRVSGTLHFNRRGARAKSVNAVYLDRAVKLDVTTRRNAPHDTRIQISGRADRQFVAKHLTNSGLLGNAGDASALWLERIGGETEWVASIDIPAAESGAHSAGISLESALEGLSIDLPYPVGKDALAPRPLAISMRAGGGERRTVQVRYGDDAHVALELEARNGSQAIRRGAVRLGGADARLPEGDGIYVEGALAHLPAGEWTQAWNSAFAPAGTNPPRQERLKEVALDIGRLELLGSSFEQVRIQAERNGDGSWNTRIDGPGLKGTVRLLEAAGDSTLLASFEEIDYRSAPGDTAGENGIRVADPRDIPAIRLTSERFTFNGRNLGMVKLSATSTDAGLNFGDISVASADFEARANGFWHQQDGAHRSEFSIRVHSGSLGGFLESMGFDGASTSGGETDVFVNARWDASPMEFDLRKLNGALHFRSNKGRLLGVKRGTTERIFGLLSITTLPQRLLLDFTDLFEKGVSYDSIEGSFNLANGEAYTNNLTMETDTARIEIAGRTGLVAEDYDQVMTVTPKLTSSLPLAPIWLAEKAFNRELFGKAFSAQYTITGSWANPKIEPLQVEANPAEKG